MTDKKPLYDLAEPEAPAMMQSLRAFGYDLSTAIADIIDNSITAEAQNIQIDFEWNDGDPKITVLDDGLGMTKDELVKAMKPSSRNPLLARAEGDLGRFGLGLKTASLSQCRNLTVFSKCGGVITGRCWDLDFLKEEEKWALIRIDPEENPKRIEGLEQLESGTLVVWDKIDRIFDDEMEIDDRHKVFLQNMEQLRKHLAMVFHVFLTGKDKLIIRVGDVTVEPWDPFMSYEDGVRPRAVEKLPYRNVPIVVQPFILPHKSKLSARGLKEGGGTRGWNDHQGFYIYRKDRMIVAGSWLGIFQKEEHFKLARIRIDIPNSLDHAWGLDVRKAKATPPPEILPELKRIASVARKEASEVYRHRGKVIQRKSTDQSQMVWLYKVKEGKHYYSINRNHAAVERCLKDGVASKSEINQMLRVIEETLPASHIVISNQETPDSLPGAFEEATEDLISIAKELYQVYLTDGFSESEAVDYVLGIEPFSNYPELRECLKPEM
jgi:hypothetical protein